MNMIRSIGIAVVVCLAAGHVAAQLTEFNYQGSLASSSVTANGSYDFQFELYDALSGGNLKGTALTRNSVAVANGIFLVSLDFGAQFSGGPRFLQISVAPTGASLTLLSPRQPVMRTPYATFADSAQTASSASSLNGVAASQFVQTGDGRLSDARQPTAGSSSYIQNGPGSPQTASINVTGNATAGGTVDGNIVNTGTQYNAGGVRFLYSPPNSVNTFLGKETGSSGTSGNLNSFVGFLSGSGTTSGSSNAFFGAASGLANTTGSSNTLVGVNAGVASGNLTGASAFGNFAMVSQSDSLVLGRPGTRVGIGISNPVMTLHVVAASAKATVATTRVFSMSTNDAYTGPGNPAAPFTLDIRLTGAATLANRAAYVQTTDLDSLDGGNILLQPAAGKVGIGTTSPTETLSVNGTASKTGGGSWATFSDERLKNIKGNFTRGVKDLLALQPIRYEYRTDNALGIKPGGEFIGFGAQALEKSIPEAVSTNETGYRLVNNDPILWTMLNAIKEQQAQIQTLRSANATLAMRLVTIERTLKRKRHGRQRL
jgi:hypothetical protein